MYEIATSFLAVGGMIVLVLATAYGLIIFAHKLMVLIFKKATDTKTIFEFFQKFNQLNQEASAVKSDMQDAHIALSSALYSLTNDDKKEENTQLVIDQMHFIENNYL